MLHSNNSIIKHKTGLLNLVKVYGNVSQFCKIMGGIKRHVLQI